MRYALLFAMTAVSLVIFSRWAISRGLFDVKEVRIVGARYSDPMEVLEVVSPELEQDIFADHHDAIVTLLRMPLIKSVDFDRIPPDRIVIHMTERKPIALLGGETLRPIDEDGYLLPIALSRLEGDLPIIEPVDDYKVDAVGRADSESIRSSLRFLAGLREMNYPLFEDISVLSWRKGKEIRFTTVNHGYQVYVYQDMSVDDYRLLTEIMNDLERESMDGRTIDMRYADQVVVH